MVSALLFAVFCFFKSLRGKRQCAMLKVVHRLKKQVQKEKYKTKKADLNILIY